MQYLNSQCPFHEKVALEHISKHKHFLLLSELSLLPPNFQSINSKDAEGNNRSINSKGNFHSSMTLNSYPH